MAVTVTPQQLIDTAATLIGAKSPVESLSAENNAFAFIMLNLMVDSWGVQPLTTTVNKREVFALTSGKGGPSNPYYVGPSGDFNTVRPVWLTGAGLLQTNLSPAVEIPRTLLTDEGYQNIAIKDLSSTYFTSVYYNATFEITGKPGMGTVNLYPVPSTTVNSLVLYSRESVLNFASLTATYTLPPGYAQVLADNLAVQLSDPFGKTTPPVLTRRASMGLSAIKRANVPMTDLSMDPALTTGARKPWNILSDSPNP